MSLFAALFSVCWMLRRTKADANVLLGLLYPDASLGQTPAGLMLLLPLCCSAPKPSPGPHKQRECLPLTVLLRNRLK